MRGWWCWLLCCCLCVGGSFAQATETHPETHGPGIDVAPRRVGIGDVAPTAGLEVEAADGSAVPLAELLSDSDPTLLVFFMTSTCTGCMQQLTELAEYAAAFGELGTRLIAISADAPSGTRQTLKTLSAESPSPIAVYGDPDLDVIQAYGVQIPGEPLSFHSVLLIDATGVLRLVARGDAAPANLPSPKILLAETRRWANAPD